LRASEEQHRLLFDANPNPAVGTFDAETMQFVAVNAAAIGITLFARRISQHEDHGIRPAEMCRPCGPPWPEAWNDPEEARHLAPPAEERPDYRGR